jgi:hypothetical protein
MSRPLRLTVALALLSAALGTVSAAPAGAVDSSCPIPVNQPQSTVRACSPSHLADLLNSDFRGRITIPRDVRWEMKRPTGEPIHDLPVKSGVEIVGERGALGSRPTLTSSDNSTGYVLLFVTGNDVRISGINFVGPKPVSTHARSDPDTTAINVLADYDQKLGRRVLVEDSEFSLWSKAGVRVGGAHDVRLESDWDPAWTKPTPADASLIRVERNYMHDIVMDGEGQGVLLAGGAYVSITGNVFDNNRHAVEGIGRAFSGYTAQFNYVLEGGTKQGSYYNQHFDVHGVGSGGYGGPAGTFFDIASNTMRGEQSYYLVKTRPALMLRGKPTNGFLFRGNVLVHDDLDAAVSLKGSSGATGIGEDQGAFNFRPGRNTYDADYSTEIASGDFDGDRRTDVFLANGTAWWYSRAGIKQWELLRPSTVRTGELGFADIDNDGRTDVVAADGGRLGYYTGGTGPFTRLSTLPVPVSEIRFGDFDGDRKTDMFYTRNGQWYVCYGSTRTWTPTQTSSAKIKELLFGDFDRVPGTDVVAVRNNAWSYSSGSTKPWARLSAKLTSNFDNAVVADFDGDGRDDIGVSEGSRWRYSKQGWWPLALLRSGNLPSLKSVVLGRFDGGARTTAISFYGDRFVHWGGLGSSNQSFTRSPQDMR